MSRIKQIFDLPDWPDLRYEDEARSAGHALVCGIDEAGRGPLAGEVVAAAVILPAGYELAGLHDSKKLTAKRRESLYEQLMADDSVLKSIASATVEEVDRINILKATHLAMGRAARGLGLDGLYCLIDGLAVPQFPFDSQNLVKGDARSLSISAASVLAKVWRDGQMKQLDELYPQYGFARHAGYGTKAHMEAIAKYGITPHHRRSFGPVAQRCLALEF